MHYFTSPITGEKLIIAKADMQFKMQWLDAVLACKRLGEGWRLPMLEELKYIREEFFKNGIGSFKEADYWSSDRPFIGFAWAFRFRVSTIETISQSEDNYCFVRAVRKIEYFEGQDNHKRDLSESKNFISGQKKEIEYDEQEVYEEKDDDEYGEQFNTNFGNFINEYLAEFDQSDSDLIKLKKSLRRLNTRIFNKNNGVTCNYMMELLPMLYKKIYESGYGDEFHIAFNKFVIRYLEMYDQKDPDLIKLKKNLNSRSNKIFADQNGQNFNYMMVFLPILYKKMYDAGYI